MTTIDDVQDLKSPDHAANRARDYTVHSDTMIARLRAAEFDRLDAIIVNGGTCQVDAIAKTLGFTVDHTERKLYTMRTYGLVEVVKIGMTNARGGHAVNLRAFQLTLLGTRLFREALALMDRGEAAA